MPSWRRRRRHPWHVCARGAFNPNFGQAIGVLGTATMKIRPLASHACDQRSTATRATRRVEQIRIEAISLAVAFSCGAIGTESIGRDVAGIAVAHGEVPWGKISRWEVRGERAAGAAWRGR